MVAADVDIIGGPEPVAIVIADYDPHWPSRYAAAATSIRAALEGSALRLEHIGSTSVPGLAAKPIIDVLLVVANSADEASYLPQLTAAGYVLRVREPGFDQHRMLRTPARDLHLHVFSAGSVEVERYLLLRTLLRQDPTARSRYEKTKRALAQQDWPTMDHYANAKTEIIEALIAEARTRYGATGGAGAAMLPAW